MTNGTSTGPPAISLANSHTLTRERIARIALINQLSTEVIIRMVAHLTILELTDFATRCCFFLKFKLERESIEPNQNHIYRKSSA
jgi:hypothetical protein